MFNRLLHVSVVIALSLGGASAQQQPYAGLQSRLLKALSEQQLADLRAGRGMQMALPAELNNYPGPMHVLELADRLVLTAEQREQMQRLYETMKTEAIPLGERLIAEETELDRLFADRTITPAALDATTSQIGATQARLRAAHLRYHLRTVEVLTADQVRRYAELRGYSGGTQSPSHHPGMHQGHR